MKIKQRGSVSIVVIIVILVCAVGICTYFYNKNVSMPVTDEGVEVSTTTSSAVTKHKDSLSDSEFISVVDDPQAKVVARGDINNDGYEDAIVQDMHCGASCSIGLLVVFNQQNSSVKLFTPEKYETFEPAYMSSSAAKSQITSVSIKDGIISLTGYGLSCGGDRTKDTDLCTEEKWRVLKTVNYKFDGTNLIQLSVNEII
jgi:hypothetical protein